MGGSKGPNMQPALDYQERHTSKDNRFNAGPLGGSRAYYDEQNRRTIGDVNANPLLEQSLVNTLQRLANFDQDAEAAAQRSYDVNYRPVQSDIQKQLSNLYAGIGPVGRRGSAGQRVLAGYAQELADGGGQQMERIREGVVDRKVQRNANLLNTNLAALSPLLNAANPNTMAQTMAGVGQSGANMLMQAEIQRSQQQQSGLNSLLGGIGGLAGLAGSMFMGR